MEKKELKYCLKLLNEALALARSLDGHISELKNYWDLKEFDAEARSLPLAA